MWETLGVPDYNGVEVMIVIIVTMVIIVIIGA